MFGSDAIVGSDIGAIVGLSLGGAVSGLVTGLALRDKYPEMKLGHILVITVGWAVAMFVVAELRYRVALAIDW
jgi:hypothetical protein